MLNISEFSLLLHVVFWGMGDFMKNKTVREVIESGKYGVFADYFWSFITDDHLNNTLDAYGYEATGMELGLKRCALLAESDGKNGASYMHYIYSNQEIYKVHELQETKLFFFPAKVDSEAESILNSKNEASSDKSPFALVIPGGGFARQWTLIEGFSIAARLNELGLSTFVLLYRTSQQGVIHKSLEDMYKAVSFIQNNAERFGVNKDRYILGGFSAGATLAGEMASDNLGWKANNLPQPEMIFLGYPAHKMDLFYKIWDEAPEGSPARIGMSDFLQRLCPGQISYDAVKPFILEQNLSKDICPPLFIIANEDDPVVPVINSKSLYQTCLEKGIPVKSKIGKTGGHSYGLGIGLEVDGWLDEAIKFWAEAR
jgi:acetyl esterase/lipase